MTNFLRKGRLTSIETDVLRYTSSLKNDLKLFKHVIKINQAHVIMMVEQKILDSSNGTALLKALDSIKKNRIGTSHEDIHMYIEEEVTKRVGLIVGGNLHIAKSRNDQVSTAIRMELREKLLRLISSIMKIQSSMSGLAEKHTKTIFPGYTHLQPAQPVTFCHYLLSYIDSLERDTQRLQNAYRRTNLSPMGACALATTSFNIDRKRVSNLLGFDDLLENSIDAVSSRDFLLETMAALTVIAITISQIAEDLIIWSSLDFGLIELPDDFASTSSIMPQKKNPDVIEVIRSRMANILGNFVSCATALRTLPSGYNLDLQEATPVLWNSLDTVERAIQMLSKLFPKLKINNEALDKPLFNLITSTELANILTRKYGVPFRTSHRIIGTLCKYIVENGLTASNITPALLGKIIKEVSGHHLTIKLNDIQSALDPTKFVEAHSVIGGPSPIETKRMIESRQLRRNTLKNWSTDIKYKLAEADRKLKTINVV